MVDIEDPLFVQEEIPIRNAVIRNFGIRSITGQSFAINNDETSASGFKSYFLECAPSGKRIRQEQYNCEGSLIHEWIYDDRGIPLREIAHKDSGEINFRIESICNHEGDWKEKQFYLSGNEIHYRIVANRDAQGRLSEGIYFDSSDQRIRVDSYVYDERSKLVRIDMGQPGAWIYEYDENDNLKRKSGNLSSASLLGEDFEFEYEESGLLAKTNHLYSEVTIFDYKYSV